MQEDAIYTVPQLRAAVTGTTMWDQPSVIRLGHRLSVTIVTALVV